MADISDKLLKRFLRYTAEHDSIDWSAPTLLAVSGGVDSVVMAHLYAAAAYPFGIAHCNFGLRQQASDDDAVFVKALAELLDAKYYETSFSTQQVAEEEGVSVQMAARELRYEWLEQLRDEQGYQYVATAHHLNDSLETSLINFSRGTGIRGLLGIPEHHENIVRPLLIFTRADIEEYARAHQIEFREDESNRTDSYQRNRLRHHLIPVLRQINPSIEQTFRKNVSRWTETWAIREWAVEELGRRYTQQLGDKFRIDYRFVQLHPIAAKGLLFTWLKDFGFHGDQIGQAIEAAHGHSGAVWYSDEYRMLAGRKAFWVEKLPHIDPDQRFTITADTRNLQLPNGTLHIQLIRRYPSREALRAANVAYIDAERLSFPLTVRHWQEGDVFCPLGMDGHHKKVQDFFTDQKVNRFDKERIWIVTTAEEEIVWIIGHRLDDRFKLTERTRHILHLVFRRTDAAPVR